MDETPQGRAPRATKILPAALLITAAVLVGIFLFRNNGAPRPKEGRPVEKQKLTREQSLELLVMRDQAVGYLENHEFAQAEKLLQKIIQLLPEDPFGYRNLAICQELAVEKIDRQEIEARQKQLLKARQTAEQDARIEPRSAAPHVLAARIAEREEDPERATASLRRATELEPKAAQVWYDLYVLRPIAPGETPDPETVEALRKVRELEPNNLFVLKDWLPLQAQLKEPGFADTVKQARETLEPFADVIKVNIRVDIRDLLARLETAIADQQWPTATSVAISLRNVIAPESARDERYVRWNSLEYVVFDFGPTFYDRADLPPVTGADPIPVKFVPGVNPMTIPAEAQDLATADLNLDGRLDGVALLDKQVVVTVPLLPKPGESVATLSLDLGEGYHRVLTVDLDGDEDKKLRVSPLKNALADPDLIVFGPAGLKFVENRVAADESKRELVDRPVGDSLSALRDIIDIIPADLDLDGDLDFATLTATGVQQWSNRGNWTFEEITARSQLPAANFGPTAAVAVDWDRDADLDLLLAGKTGFGFMENLRHGRYRWRDLSADFARATAAKSLLVEDVGNGSWNVLAAGPGGVDLILTQTSAAGMVSKLSDVHITDESANAAMPLDYDNDGHGDLLTIHQGKATLRRGLLGGQFESLNVEFAGDLSNIAAMTIADVDDDGDEDLILATAGKTEWRSNEGGNANGWLNVTLIAEQVKPGEQNYSKRVNHYGIGCTIEIKSGQKYLTQVVRGPVTHFGLGPQKTANVMRILWTNGIPNNSVDPATNQTVYEEQKLGGSCPYLFTWDGEKFAFCTDLLWNAPLGLKFAEDVVAPWREWEYLKIDGDRLKPKDGEYQLRVTADLWEIEYFDQIKLFAVDHPAGTQIFTNEKVGPASLAEHKIHTVADPRPPVAARDTFGNDILDQVQTCDGIFTKTYERKIAQGLTTEHFLELDLGVWNHGDTQPTVTLFLTGWMYPGCTSLSVQHSQNPEQARQRPPALHAVDGQGQWREVRPFMGFPGGKTKTIAVDISDVFSRDATDHRVRIVTNMEFYWDAAFITVNDRPVEFVQAELPLISANLIDRGGVAFRQWPVSGNGPELFTYEQLVPGDMWPPIEGKFTRLGSVHPLLTERDDQLVVMHPGDEIQLSFAAPTQSVREGWVRDFVIFNVGWDKDCDMHTVYGETSEPLPFRAMTVYPFRDGEPRPIDPDYARYLQTYQTRTRNRSPFWNQVRRQQ
ncbi:MAG: VCBS repeat-containing protein [Planctomycetes bacterium]|nr:VCBS repeat-containing protein [Planctomycetota bacterium]